MNSASLLLNSLSYEGNNGAQNKALFDQKINTTQESFKWPKLLNSDCNHVDKVFWCIYLSPAHVDGCALGKMVIKCKPC